MLKKPTLLTFIWQSLLLYWYKEPLFCTIVIDSIMLYKKLQWKQSLLSWLPDTNRVQNLFRSKLTRVLHQILLEFAINCFSSGFFVRTNNKEHYWYKKKNKLTEMERWAVAVSRKGEASMCLAGSRSRRSGLQQYTLILSTE